MSHMAHGLWAAILLLAIALRAGTALFAYMGGELYPINVDSYYHLRVAEMMAANFPVRPVFDAYLNYPEGLPVPWPPLFDQLNLLVTWLLSPRSTVVSHLPTVAAAASVAWGVVNVTLLYGLARQLLTSRAPALLAMFFLAVLPGHVVWTQFANVDHHSAEACLSTAFYACLLAALDRGRPARSRDLWALVGGTVLVAFYQTWHGAGVVAVLAAFYLVALSLHLYRQAQPVVPLVRSVAIVFVLSTAGLWAINGALPLGRRGSFEYFYPSLFQPALLSLIGIMAVGVPYLLQLKSQGQPRRGWVVSTGAAVFVLAAVAFYRPFLAALDYLVAGGDTLKTRLLITIAETQPLFYSFAARGYTAFIAHHYFSWAVWLLPLGWWRIWRHWQGLTPEGMIFLVVWPLGTAALVLTQQRFAPYFSVVAAILYAGLLVQAWEWLKKRGWRGDTAALALATSAAVLMLPAWSWLVSYRQNYYDSTFSPALRDLLVWMRWNTPEPGDYLHPFRTPAYGVLSNWDMGHVIVYYAHRPVIGDNFLNGIDATTQFFVETQENAFDALMRRGRVRYLLVGDPVPYVAAALYVRHMDSSLYLGPGPALRARPAVQRLCVYRLYRFDGSEVVSSLNPADTLPALRHYSLVREADPQRTVYSKVFEFVPGARLQGANAQPHQAVTAFVPVETNRGRRFTFVVSGAADRRGRFSLEVPYALGTAKSSVHALLPYTVLAGGKRIGTAVVHERDVSDGRRVSVVSGLP